MAPNKAHFQLRKLEALVKHLSCYKTRSCPPCWPVTTCSTVSPTEHLTPMSVAQMPLWRSTRLPGHWFTRQAPQEMLAGQQPGALSLCWAGLALEDQLRTAWVISPLLGTAWMASRASQH